jgi:hypothetical protein
MHKHLRVKTLTACELKFALHSIAVNAEHLDHSDGFT